MPGPSLHAAPLDRSSNSVISDHRGRWCSGFQDRRPLASSRRAGSTCTYRPLGSSFVTSSTEAVHPALRAVIQHRRGSRSTACTSQWERSAIASPPIPQHRSRTEVTCPSTNRRAFHSPTRCEVACSTPEVSHQSSEARVNLAAARRRAWASSIAAETTGGGHSRRNRWMSAAPGASREAVSSTNRDPETESSCFHASRMAEVSSESDGMSCCSICPPITTD